MNSYIFSGTGFAHGKHKIQNKQIEDALDKAYLTGFNKKRVEEGDSYKKYKESGGNDSAFSFMAKYKMGFDKRSHVVPFPPSKESYKKAENTLDLAVRAADEAIYNSGISADDIDMWMVSTATPHEMAPGLAATLKCYFVPAENQSPTHSLTSACVGFNINIQIALEKMKSNPEIKHILLVHTEVMSELLCNEKDFVPVTSFGDAAAGVVLSAVETEKQEGIIAVKNYEDLRMLDFLGAYKSGDLYMNPRVVKSRAVPNMVKVSGELLKETGWTSDSYKIFIPHQTGHAIVKSVAEKAGIPESKLYQNVQLKYGNLSGASVPAGYHELKKEGRLNPGDKIITAVAGLGGEFGGFTYIEPEKHKFKASNGHLQGKNVLITGSTGDLAGKTSELLLKKGANLILHYRNEEKAKELKNKFFEYQKRIKFIKADLSDNDNVNKASEKLNKIKGNINYFIHIAASTGSLSRASEVSDEEMKQTEYINHRSCKILINSLYEKITDSVVIVGSVAEDALFSGSSSYVSSKKALHSFAKDIAAKMYRDNKKIVYYMPGIIDAGMAAKLSESQKKASMLAINQDKLIPLETIAERIIKSLYLPKVSGVESNYEGALMVRRDGYIKEDLI